ncbi:hypothetical protein VZT92_021253 [Zoarces viviparus]|uniref:Uncharacterized protein n=1 Tax=Zoarces viviparus TaxID=48416 RepID=A0AAW1EH03_ZOAVI
MADQATGKSVEQLKVERTTAKRLFTRLVNSITRTHEDMSEEELRDSFNKLKIKAEKVMGANEDVKAGFIAELEAELDKDEYAVLTEQQKADLGRTSDECEMKLKETRSLIQEAL